MRTDIIVFDRKVSSEYDRLEEMEDYEDDQDFTMTILKRKKVKDVCARIKERFREDLTEVRRVRLLEQHSQICNFERQMERSSASKLKKQLTDTEG